MNDEPNYEPSIEEASRSRFESLGEPERTQKILDKTSFLIDYYGARVRTHSAPGMSKSRLAISEQGLDAAEKLHAFVRSDSPDEAEFAEFRSRLQLSQDVCIGWWNLRVTAEVWALILES